MNNFLQFLVNAGQYGWFSFTLLTPVYLVAGRSYLVFPRDPDPSVGQYGWNGYGDGGVTQFSPDCAYQYQYNIVNCGICNGVIIDYAKEDCCDPHCVHGGVCQSAGTCDCTSTVYSGDQCETSK